MGTLKLGGVGRVRTSGAYVGSAWPTLIPCFSWETTGWNSTSFNKLLMRVVVRNPKIYLKVQISYPSTAVPFCAITNITISLDIPTSTGCSTPNLYHSQGNTAVENNKRWCIHWSSDRWNCCCDTMSPLPRGCLLLFLELCVCGLFICLFYNLAFSLLSCISKFS